MLFLVVNIDRMKCVIIGFIWCSITVCQAQSPTILKRGNAMKRIQEINVLVNEGVRNTDLEDAAKMFYDSSLVIVPEKLNAKYSDLYSKLNRQLTQAIERMDAEDARVETVLNLYESGYPCDAEKLFNFSIDERFTYERTRRIREDLKQRLAFVSGICARNEEKINIATIDYDQNGERCSLLYFLNDDFDSTNSYASSLQKLVSLKVKLLDDFEMCEYYSERIKRLMNVQKSTMEYYDSHLSL